jgi:hypothetical protein
MSGMALAQLLARSRDARDQRKEDLLQVQWQLRQVERALAAVYQRLAVAQVLHDALARECEEQAARLRREWEGVLVRPGVTGARMVEGAVLLEIGGQGSSPRSVRLAPGILEVSAAWERELTSVQRRGLLRALRAGRLGGVLDRLGVPARGGEGRPPAEVVAGCVEVCLAPWRARQAEARAEVQAASQEIGRLEEEWERLSQREEELMLAVRGKGEGELSAADLAAWDRLQAVPGVASVALVEDCLVVETLPVEVVWAGRRYQLGRYRIRFWPLSGRLEVRAVGSTDPQGRDHPHIVRGNPCLGEGVGYARALWHAGDVAGLVRFVIAFLHSYSPESAYRPLTDWPSVPEEGARGAGV